MKKTSKEHHQAMHLVEDPRKPLTACIVTSCGRSSKNSHTHQIGSQWSLVCNRNVSSLILSFWLPLIGSCAEQWKRGTRRQKRALQNRRIRQLEHVLQNGLGPHPKTSLRWGITEKKEARVTQNNVETYYDGQATRSGLEMRRGATCREGSVPLEADH